MGVVMLKFKAPPMGTGACVVTETDKCEQQQRCTDKIVEDFEVGLFLTSSPVSQSPICFVCPLQDLAATVICQFWPTFDLDFVSDYDGATAN